MPNRYSFTLRLAAVLVCAVLPLASCKTGDSPLAPAIDSMMGKRALSEARLSTAAAAAIAQGREAEALAHYEKLYRRTLAPTADLALNYGQLLRRAGRVAEAMDVVGPRAAAGSDARLRTEYAALLIAQGRFADAEKTLDAVLEDEKAKPAHNDAYNLMGVALDARGNRREAEQMFRQALDGWQGDASSVLNNLGLNLAGQGKFDESLDVLRRALLAAPDREEIARNMMIVTDLRDKVVRRAPPVKKAAPKKKT